jgi:RimJ/RimL family protein N-acetyltransferase
MFVQGRLSSVLRQAEARDASAMVALRADFQLQQMLMANPDFDQNEDMLSATNNWIARRQAQGWFRVVDAGKGAEGFAQIAEIHHRNRFGWLGIALVPEARGRGLGARALAEAETAAARELGLRKLLLQVRFDNSAALGLYDGAGWRRAGRLLEQYDDGNQFHDVLILEKALA